jgi:hypothetical protein
VGDLAKNWRLLSIAKGIQALAYKELSNFRPLPPQKRRQAQEKFIRQTEKSLRPEGFRPLGVFAYDMVYLGLDLSVDFGLFLDPETRSYMMASAMALKTSGLVEKIITGLRRFLGGFRVLRIASRLSDGRIVGVIQTPAIPDYFDHSPNFIFEKASRWVSPRGIVRRHRRLLERCLAEAPGVAVLALPSPAEVRQTEMYTNSLENEYRQSLPDLVSVRELKKMLGFNYKEWSGFILEKIALLEQLRREAEPAGRN